MNITELKKIKNPFKKGTLEYNYFEYDREMTIQNTKIFKKSKFLETMKKFVRGKDAKNGKKNRTIQKDCNKN